MHLCKSGCQNGQRMFAPFGRRHLDLPLARLAIGGHEIGSRGFDLPEQRFPDRLGGRIILLLESIGPGNPATLRVEHKYLYAGIIRNNSME